MAMLQQALSTGQRVVIFRRVRQAVHQSALLRVLFSREDVVSLMKPLLIISHVASSHPDYLCEYLEQRDLPYQRFCVESSDPMPDPEQIAGLALLGAPLSVNSDLAWIHQEMALVRHCVERAIPVLGICFGSQLISKAFGGLVFTAPAMQIGWHPVTTTQQCQELFVDLSMPEQFTAFEWHEETFTLPNGAIPMFSGGCIGNQGFLYKSCLAVQFHPEVTDQIVRDWVAQFETCVEKPTICRQDRDAILQDLPQKLAAMRQISDKLFDWWVSQSVTGA